MTGDRRSGTERGYLISFEGGEGSGKSTQISYLAASLEKQGATVVQTREPGGTEGAETIRSLLVQGETKRWDPETEGLLHYAARRDHVERLIRPAMISGACVLCDRFSDSTMAYQGYAYELGRGWVDSLHEIVLGAFKPDITIILDLPVETGLARAGRRGGTENRYERLGAAFHEAVREGFLDIARREVDRCTIIDASMDVDAVAQAVRDVVGKKLNLALKSAA